MTNDNKLPVEVASMQPQAPPPPNEVFIRVGTTLYKVVDQPTINGGKVRKRIPWNMETLRQDYGKEFIKYVHKYDGFCTVPEHVNHQTWRKRSIPTHSGWLYPLTFDAEKGLKEA